MVMKAGWLPPMVPGRQGCIPDGWVPSLCELGAPSPARVITPYVVVEHGGKGQPGQVRVQQAGSGRTHSVPSQGGGSRHPTDKQEVSQGLQRQDGKGKALTSLEASLNPTEP